MKKADRELRKKIESYGRISSKGAVKYLCGEKIGSGLNRDVYVCRHNPEWVVKIQRTINHDNVIEWHLYQYLYEASWWEKWFAPCLVMNELGTMLVQKRVEHRPKKEYPKRVPAFFTDMKTINYGWIGDQFVCCDYSSVLAMLVGKMGKEMRNAKWWTLKKKQKSGRVKSIMKGDHY